MMQVVYNDVLFPMIKLRHHGPTLPTHPGLQNTTLWAIESSFWKFGKWNVEIKILEKLLLIFGSYDLFQVN